VEVPSGEPHDIEEYNISKLKSRAIEVVEHIRAMILVFFSPIAASSSTCLPSFTHYQSYIPTTSKKLA
jgi:argininosuccinate lyase